MDQRPKREAWHTETAARTRAVPRVVQVWERLSAHGSIAQELRIKANNGSAEPYTIERKPSREEEAHRGERISTTNTSGRGLIAPKYKKLKKKKIKESKSPKQTNNPPQTNPFRRQGTDLIEFSKEVRKVAESQFIGPSKAKSKSTIWPRSTLLGICPKGSTSYSVDTC